MGWTPIAHNGNYSTTHIFGLTFLACLTLLFLHCTSLENIPASTLVSGSACEGAQTKGIWGVLKDCACRETRVKFMRKTKEWRPEANTSPGDAHPSNLALRQISILAATNHNHSSATLQQIAWREPFNYAPDQLIDQMYKWTAHSFLIITATAPALPIILGPNTGLCFVWKQQKKHDFSVAKKKKKKTLH